MNRLWLYLIIGYAIIWAAMILSDRKRGRPIEDAGLYTRINRTQMALRGYLPLLALLGVSIFVPASSGTIFRIGLGVAVPGVVLNCIAMYSFSRLPEGLNTTGVYRFSRNPMYVGGFVFLVGLNLIGWRVSIASITFALFTAVWAGATHWTVLREEAFLEEKYGDAYAAFKRRIPRYIGIVRASR